MPEPRGESMVAVLRTLSCIRYYVLLVAVGIVAWMWGLLALWLQTWADQYVLILAPPWALTCNCVMTVARELPSIRISGGYKGLT